MPLRALGVLAPHALREPRALRGREPVGVRGAIGQVAERDEAEPDRRQALQEEEPLPARQPAQAAELLEDLARDRPAHHARDRGRGHEARHGARLLGGREPVREVEDHAGEEARLGGAEEETEGVEARHAAHEHHGRRDDAPGDHDARHPHARAHPVHDQVARHLEEEVADEEDARAEAVDGVREAQVLPHLERREADVDAVEVGDHVEDEHEGDQAAGHLRQDGRGEGRVVVVGGRQRGLAWS